MNQGWCVYILSSHTHTTYTGSTNDLMRRLHEHKAHKCENAFTARYTFNLWSTTSSSLTKLLRAPENYESKAGDAGRKSR